MESQKIRIVKVMRPALVIVERRAHDHDEVVAID